MKLIPSLTIILFLISVLFSSGLADSPWPMFHGGPKHGGLSPYDTSHVDGTVEWMFTPPFISDKAMPSFESSPSIGPDGTIYVGYAGNGLYAINPDGTEKWYFDAGDPVADYIWDDTMKGVISSPAVAEDGTIYFTSLSDYLFSVNSEGIEKWRFPLKRSTAVWSSPLIGPDGTVYVGSAATCYDGCDMYSDLGGNGMFAVNPDGTLKWRFFNAGDVVGSPAIDEDGVVYVGAFDGDERKGKVYAVNPDGTLKWEFSAEKYIESSPAISSDGTIYVGSGLNELYAINSDGTLKWTFFTSSAEVFPAPAIGTDGTIYFGCGDFTGEPNFYAINSDGSLKWEFDVDGSIEGSASIGADGTIYFGSAQGTFYAINPDGTEKWSFETNGGISSTPAIDSDGTVYVSSHGSVYAFTGSESGVTLIENTTIIEEGNVTIQEPINQTLENEQEPEEDNGLVDDETDEEEEQQENEEGLEVEQESEKNILEQILDSIFSFFNWLFGG